MNSQNHKILNQFGCDLDAADKLVEAKEDRWHKIGGMLGELPQAVLFEIACRYPKKKDLQEVKVDGRSKEARKLKEELASV